MYPRRPSSSLASASVLVQKELDRALDKHKVDLLGRDFPELLYDWRLVNDKSARKNLRSYLVHIPTETLGAPINSLENIAEEAGVDAEYLREVLDGSLPKSEPRLIKRKSKARIVHAPTAQYRKVLDWIYLRVVSPLDRKNHNFCHAYRTAVRRNTVTCMAPHSNSDWFINLDIKHFFESVKSSQIYEIFADEFDEPALLTDLVMIHVDGRRTLPQGFPTSGVLANLALRKFDSKLSNWIRGQRKIGLSLNYTRYSDDIVISGRFTPDDWDPTNEKWSLSAEKRKIYINVVKSLLEKYGFALNRKKTRFVEFPNTFRALGVEIKNHKLQPDRRTRNFLSMQCYGIADKGLDSQAERWASRNCGCVLHLDTGAPKCKRMNYAPMISGYLTYCASIDPEFVSGLRHQIATKFPLIVGDKLDTSLIRWKDARDTRDVDKCPGRFHLNIPVEVEGFVEGLPGRLWDLGDGNEVKVED